MANSVIVKDFTNARFEGIANAAITPGHLVEVMSTGKIRKHASAGAVCERAFALESELEGGLISTDYDASDNMFYGIFRSGDEVQARIKSGESIVIGDKLESAGDGTLQEYAEDSSGQNWPIAVALAASTGGLCIVRIL